VTVELSDATGYRASVTIAVSVAASTSTPFISGELLGLALVTAGLLVLILACGLVLVRRYRVR
jgi:hypothetical protein